MTSLPGAAHNDNLTITPAQHQAHQTAQPIVRAHIQARGWHDEGELLGMLGLEVGL
jgi:hypothetical protein